MLEYPSPNRWNLVCETVSAMELCLSLPYAANGYPGQFRRATQPGRAVSLVVGLS